VQFRDRGLGIVGRQIRRHARTQRLRVGAELARILVHAMQPRRQIGILARELTDPLHAREMIRDLARRHRCRHAQFHGQRSPGLTPPGEQLFALPVPHFEPAQRLARRRNSFVQYRARVRRPGSAPEDETLLIEQGLHRRQCLHGREQAVEAHAGVGQARTGGAACFHRARTALCEVLRQARGIAELAQRGE
jgi:hypothetical protein